MYDIILFDLDGTLTESAPGICRSVQYSLKKFGIEVEHPESLQVFVGPPLIDSFKRYYGLDDAQARQAVEYYREYYCSGGMFENAVYDGVEEMLRALKSAGKKIVMATSKPEPLAVQIMEHFGLDKYFDVMAGASMDETRTDKASVIAYALGKIREGLPEQERPDALDQSSVIMVGDREHDVNGARKNDLECIGVLYGYGSREELKQAGAAYIAETPADVADIVLGKND